MTKRHLLLGLGLLVTLWFSFFADDTVQAPAQISEPMRQNATARQAASPPTTPERVRTPFGDSDILHLRERAVASKSLTADKLPDVPLFAATTWDIPPKPVPPPPPQAPALPYVYIGKMLKEGVWEVFLSRGEATRVIRQHEVLDTQYRVESIQPPNMTFVYLPLGQVQTLNIGKPE